MSAAHPCIDIIKHPPPPPPPPVDAGVIFFSHECTKTIDAQIHIISIISSLIIIIIIFA